MGNLNVKGAGGTVTSHAIAPGTPVMEILRDAGYPEILAVCGGVCACATCHVYVDDRFQSLLPALTEDEDELLNTSDHRTSQSRLSCQLIFSDEIDGLEIEIA